MAATPVNVLILCTGNSARSILGEAIINHLGQDQFRAYSAGSTPTGKPNPFAIALLESKGIDTGFARSKSWDEFAHEDAPAIDLVITVCDNAANETCPYWPGTPMSAHWGLPDPAAAQGSDAEIAAAFAETWSALETRVSAMMALDWARGDKSRLLTDLRAIGERVPA